MHRSKLLIQSWKRHCDAFASRSVRLFCCYWLCDSVHFTRKNMCRHRVWLPLKGFISQSLGPLPHILKRHFGDGAACSNGWYRIGRFRRFMESSWKSKKLNQCFGLKTTKEDINWTLTRQYSSHVLMFWLLLKRTSTNIVLAHFFCFASHMGTDFFFCA